MSLFGLTHKPGQEYRTVQPVSAAILCIGEAACDPRGIMVVFAEPIPVFAYVAVQCVFLSLLSRRIYYEHSGRGWRLFCGFNSTVDFVLFWSGERVEDFAGCADVEAQKHSEKTAED